MDFQTFIIGDDIDEEVSVAIQFRDAWDNAPYQQGECEYSFAVDGELRIGNLILKLTRDDLRKAIGPETLKRFEQERADSLNAGVAA